MLQEHLLFRYFPALALFVRVLSVSELLYSHVRNFMHQGKKIIATISNP